MMFSICDAKKKNTALWMRPMATADAMALATDDSRASPSFPATIEVEVFSSGSLYNLATENCALIAIPIAA